MDNGIFNGLQWDYTGIVGDNMGMPSGNQTWLAGEKEKTCSSRILTAINLHL